MSDRTIPARIEPEALARVSGGIDEHNPGGGHGGSDQPIDLYLGWGDERADGTNANDTIQGQGGADTIWGGEGRDKIFGDDGNDWLQGGRGADEIHGGRGDDYIEGNGLGATPDGERDLVFAGDGNDTFAWTKGSGSDEFHGNNGVDTLRLQDVSRTELFRNLHTDDPNLQLRHLGSGVYQFVYPNGQVASDVAGSFNLNGESVRFYNLEKVQIG